MQQDATRPAFFRFPKNAAWAQRSVVALAALLVMLSMMVAGCEEEDRPPAVGGPSQPSGGAPGGPEGSGGIEMGVRLDQISGPMRKVYDDLMSSLKDQDYGEIFDSFSPEYQKALGETAEGLKSKFRELLQALREAEAAQDASPAQNTKSQTRAQEIKTQILKILQAFGFQSIADVETLLALSPREFYARQYEYMFLKGGRRMIDQVVVKGVGKGVIVMDDAGRALLDTEGKVQIENPVDPEYAYFILKFWTQDMPEELVGQPLDTPLPRTDHTLRVLMKMEADSEAEAPSWKIIEFGPFDFKPAPKKEVEGAKEPQVRR